MLPHLYSWVLRGSEEMKGSNALRGAHPDSREKEDVSFFYHRMQPLIVYTKPSIFL